MLLARLTSAIITISIAMMLSRNTMPSRVPLATASIELTGGSSSARCAAGGRVRAKRHHQRRDRQRRRGADDGGGQDMAERAGDDRADQRGVQHHDGAGDAGHAAAHQREQLAAFELRQIGPDQQRRLDMPDKDMHRRAEPERPADPDRAPQHPGESLHDALQHAPVEQERRQRADHQHHRQRAEREDIGRAGPALGERQFAAAEIAEDKPGAGLGRLLDRLDRVRQQQKRRRGRRKFQEQQRQRRLAAPPRRRPAATRRATGPR